MTITIEKHSIKLDLAGESVEVALLVSLIMFKNFKNKNKNNKTDFYYSSSRVLLYSVINLKELNDYLSLLNLVSKDHQQSEEEFQYVILVKLKCFVYL